jgi:septal ring factor EnvC (AmiA/AmiB activator)
MEINTFKQMRFLKIALLFICVFIAVNVHAQSSSELKRQRDKLNEQIDQLNHELEETSNNKKSTLKQVDILKAQINLREAKIDNINTQVRNLDNQISESNNTVHSLQSQLAQLKKDYAGMVLFAYRNQSAYNKLMFIFASKDFNQAYKRLKYLQQFATYRERQANYIEGTEKDLSVKIVQLDKDKEEKHTLLVDQEKEKASLGKEKKDQLQVVADLTKHGGQIKQQMQELQARVARVNREVNAAVRREIEEAKRKAEEADRLAAKNEAAKAKAENRDAPVTRVVPKRTTSEALNATPEAAKLSNDFLGNKGRLPWPVAQGSISHGFGTYTMQGIRIDNTGIDIKTNSGAPVRAVFEGVVSRVVPLSGTYIVIIRHGEYFTSYSNLRSVTVSNGQKVSTKQNIGSAATDQATGETEVDFSITKGDTTVNPQIWLTPE